MASSGTTQPAGQGASELRDLREQLLALSKADSELRRELKAARGQIAQLAQNEAMARSLLKESHSVTRALQERVRLETAAATAQLREGLEVERTERAKSQAELARATDELRERRNRPDAEMETLRALFADLMRGEALGRQRLERLQKQVAEHERQRQELQQQLELEREARRKAEVELLAAALLPGSVAPADPVAGTVPAGDELREQLGQLETAVAELEKKRAALSGELAEERGKARAQTERATAEVEWARDRAKAAAESEQEAKDALADLRKKSEEEKTVTAKLESQLDELRRALAARTEAESAARAETAEAGEQLADLRKKSEEERARASAEIARRVQAVETLQEAVSAASDAAKKAAGALGEEKAIAARLRGEVARLVSAREAAQEAAREVSLRERRTSTELEETQVREAQLESQLDELRQALAARTEAESAARAATAQTEKELTDVRARLEKSETGRATLEADVAGLQGALERASAEGRAQQDEFARRLEEERARLAAAKAEHARLVAEGERLRASEEERSRTAEALAGELELARGQAETLQGALDRSGVALASLQSRHAKLETDLINALHERDEEARSRTEQAALLGEERTQAAAHIADLKDASGQKDAELAGERRARAEEVEAMRSQRDAEQKQLAAKLSAEMTRAEHALHESQELARRCDTSARELAETAERVRAAEAEAVQAKAAQERLSQVASARREALIAELDGRFADAEALLQAELGQSPLEAPVLLQLGKLHYFWAEGAPGSHEEIAERLLARAAELNQYEATATLYLGHARLRRGLHGAAAEAYRETIRRDAQCAPAHEALAVLSARSMKRQTRIAFAGAIALLLVSAALLIHSFVQGAPAPAASAISESQDRGEKNEVVPARGRAGR